MNKTLALLFLITAITPQLSFADCNSECDAEYTACSDRWEDIHPSCGPQYKECLQLCPPPSQALNVCTKDCYRESYECKNKWEGIHPGCKKTLDACLDLCP